MLINADPAEISSTFTWTGGSSTLNYNFNPPIYLDEDPSIEHEIRWLTLIDISWFFILKKIELYLYGVRIMKKVEMPIGSYKPEDLF